MKIIDLNTVVIFTSDELKEILEIDNGYKFIYFGSDITLEEDILINEKKEEIVIDGTYLNNKYTLNIDSIETDEGFTSYKIAANSKNKKIIVRNLNVISKSEYGIIYCEATSIYKDVFLEYINVKFNGIKMISNAYGNARIIDCNITVENIDSITAKEVAQITRIRNRWKYRYI